MRDHPILETERLLLRSFVAEDAERVHDLAGAEEVARTTFLPYPYRADHARSWIESQAADYRAGRLTNFAIVLRASDELIGSIGLMQEPAYQHAQLGYWLGLAYWGNGYSTEAARAVVAYGFDGLGLHRIFALHFKSNPASGRVLQKLGMTHEGCQREHFLRFSRFEDAELYGLLRREHEAAAGLRQQTVPERGSM